jgi:hypothetical protein
MSNANHIKIKSNHLKTKNIYQAIKCERKGFTAETTRQKHHTYATREPPVYKIYLNISPYPNQYLHITNHVCLLYFHWHI